MYKIAADVMDRSRMQDIYTASMKLNSGLPQTNQQTSIPSSSQTANKTLDLIKKLESGGKYDIMGPAIASGDRAYGAYQFMGNTLRGMGFKGDFNEFLNNPKLQDEYALKYMQSGIDYGKNMGFNMDPNSLEGGQNIYGYWGGGGGYFKVRKSGNFDAWLNTPQKLQGGKMFPAPRGAWDNFTRMWGQ